MENGSAAINENVQESGPADPLKPGRKPGFITRLLYGARTLLNIAVLLLALVGLTRLASELYGDGPLPRFRPLSQVAPGLVDQLAVNSVNTPVVTAAREASWRKLQPTLVILEAISPEIATWLKELHQQDRIRYRLLRIQQWAFRDRDILVSYNGNYGTLHIGQSFWYLSDGNKAAYLAHEYRHFRQNRAKVLGELLTRTLSGKIMTYGNTLEDEAYLYQLAAYRAMSMDPAAIRDYLRQRDLLYMADPGIYPQ